MADELSLNGSRPVVEPHRPVYVKPRFLIQFVAEVLVAFSYSEGEPFLLGSNHANRRWPSKSGLAVVIVFLLFDAKP